MTTQSGPFRIDRDELPARFFTPIDDDNSHDARPGQVFTQSETHTHSDWITLGYVSYQTPYGQGTYCGFPLAKLREAKSIEVLVGLTLPHPHGPDFRPYCIEAMNAGFGLLMSEAFRNWTRSGDSGRGPILPVTNEEIETHGNMMAEKHIQTMEKWDAITARQRKTIIDSIRAVEPSFYIYLNAVVDFLKGLDSPYVHVDEYEKLLKVI